MIIGLLVTVLVVISVTTGGVYYRRSVATNLMHILAITEQKKICLKSEV